MSFTLSDEVEPWMMQIVPSDVHDILCGVEQQEAWIVVVHTFTVCTLLVVIFEHL